MVGDVADPSVWDALLARFRPELVVHLAAETGHRPVAHRVHPARRHQRRRHDRDARRVRSPRGPAPSTSCSPRRRAVYGEGPWRAADGSVFAPPPRSHAQLEAGAVGPRRRRRPPGHTDRDGRRDRPLQPEQRLRLHEARPGARAPQLVRPASRSRCRSSAPRTSTAPASRRTTPTPGSSRSSTGWRRAARPSTSTRTARSTATSSTSTTWSRPCVAAIERPPAEQRVLDLGSGVRTTILDAARMIAAHHGAPEPQISGQVPRRRRALGLGRRLAPRARRSDWSPAWSFEDGSAAVSDWLKRGGFLG